MKVFKILGNLILIIVLSACAISTDNKKADAKLLELYSLYDSKNFNEVDALLERNRDYVDKYDLIAAFKLHRDIILIQNNSEINYKYSSIIPRVILNAKENGKTTYLSQSYQEYVQSKQGNLQFIDGFCPAKPISAACACRMRVVNDGVSLGYYFSERDMWFSEYLYKMCPNDALKAIHVFSAAAVSDNKATEILVEEKKLRSEGKYKALESMLCRYKTIYSDYEAPYIYMENTDLVNCI